MISSVQRLTVSSFVETSQVIGNGSFGVVYQARLIDSQEMVAIKKVLQDKRFKVGLEYIYCDQCVYLEFSFIDIRLKSH